MIEITNGNLLDAEVEALVNPVNTHGVMGKGLALLFRNAYPDMAAAYEQASQEGRLAIGRMHVYDRQTLVSPRYIINFPTKRHWREHSRLDYIVQGLDDLVRVIENLGIHSVAVPALGCGYGGLNWAEVYPQIRRALERFENVRVLVFAPQEEEQNEEARRVTVPQSLTPSRASVIGILSRYLALGDSLTLLEIHKLLYFLQEAGEPLRLRFSADRYGPYAENLQYVLRSFEGKYTAGFKHGGSNPELPIHLLPGVAEEALQYLKAEDTGSGDSVQRLERVFSLIEGFESPYSLELLSTVHYVVAHRGAPATQLPAIIQAVQAWNDRKRRLLKPTHVEIAWNRLQEQGWLASMPNLPNEQQSGKSAVKSVD